MYPSGTPTVVKNIIFLNIAVFLIQNLAGNFLGQRFIEDLFSLNYISVVYEYRFWQTITYMFLHGGFWHLFFNMLALYLIGAEIERFWGSKPFLIFYLSTGWGAGMIIFFFDTIKFFFSPGIVLGFTVGASGAIFALILIYSILFRERQLNLLIFFIFPVTIKGKNLLAVCLGLTILLPFFMGSGTKISHVGHIGGVLSAVLFLVSFKNNRSYLATYNCLIEWYKDLIGRIFKTSRPKIVRYHHFRSSPEQNLDETSMTENEIEEKIDQLLDVIAEKGINGLSEQEKKFLERVSYLYRHKFPN